MGIAPICCRKLNSSNRTQRFVGVLVSLFPVRGRDFQEQEALAVEPALEPAG